MTEPPNTCDQCLPWELCRACQAKQCADGGAVDTKQLAFLIAEALFTNGSKERAQRLVLTVDAPNARNLGGWCEGAAADVIEGVLRRETALPRSERRPFESLVRR